MSPRVLEPSRDELVARRERLLEQLGMSRSDLERAAQAGALIGDQIWLWEDIRSIEFLLRDNDDG